MTSSLGSQPYDSSASFTNVQGESRIVTHLMGCEIEGIWPMFKTRVLINV